MIEDRKVWQDSVFSKAIEGGWSDRDLAADPGGATMHGVTFATFQAVSLPTVVTLADLRQLTVDAAKVIANTVAWLPMQGDKLPAGLAVLAADFAWNSNPVQATKTLQSCLGFTGKDRDGFLGIKTLTACLKAEPHGLIRDYAAARLAFMRRLKNWQPNKNGWTTRVETMEALALHLSPEDAPIAVAQAATAKTNLVTKLSIGAVVVGFVQPLIDAIPAAKSAYTSVVGLVGPYELVWPGVGLVVGGLAIVGILYVNSRASRLAKAAIATAAVEVAVA